MDAGHLRRLAHQAALGQFFHKGFMAEGVGFEPTGPLRALQFSRLAQ